MKIRIAVKRYLDRKNNCVAVITVFLPCDKFGDLHRLLRDNGTTIFNLYLLPDIGEKIGKYRCVERKITGNTWNGVNTTVSREIEKVITVLGEVKDRNEKKMRYVKTEKMEIQI